MAYMQKALTLVKAGEEVHFIKPWWEVIQQFTVDVMMLYAVTSVTSDLFQGRDGHFRDRDRGRDGPSFQLGIVTIEVVVGVVYLLRSVLGDIHIWVLR